MERARQSLPIQGINRAESDDTVADGACEDIYNLRYRAGSFETVCAPQLIRPVNDWSGFSAVIRLDDMPEDEYAARRGDELWRVRLAEGSALPQEKIMDFPKGAADARYFGFGRMLYVNYEQGGELQEQCFRYRDNAFERVDFAAVAPPAMQVACDDMKSAAKEEFAPNPQRDYSAVKIAHIERYDDDPASNKEDFFYNVGVGALNEEGYIFGTAYIFAAYKLFDGSIVKPGALGVVSGDRGTFVGSPYLYRYTKKEGVFDYYGRVQGVRPTVSVVVPPEVADNDLIRSVVLLSTRNEPTWEYEKVHEKYGTEGYPAVSQGYGVYDCSHGCIWNAALDEPQNTFYEVAELDFRAGKNSVVLTWTEHYEHIVNNPVYEANYSIHETRSGGKYEYNNRMHIFDLRPRLYVPPTDAVFMDGYANEKRVESPDIRCGIDYTLTVDGRTVVVRTTFPGHYWERKQTQAAKPTPDSPDPGPEPIVVRTRLWYIRALHSYPDSRAERADIWVQEAGRTIAHKSVPLISSPGANLSFRQLQIEYDSNNKVTTWTQRNTIPERLELAEDPDSDYVPAPDAETNPVLLEPNKIQVSRSSNPFVYDPAHIYTVGGSGERIRQIISTAERMTEAVYGYQPLLVFTDRTVYALESGEGEMLYARTIPILSRTIVEGTNAVEGEGAVFFVSTSGITAIVRGQISSVSDAMKRWAGLRPADEVLADFDDYARSARLMFNRKESELIVYNPATDYAYIYSLSGQYWTRRAWDGVVEPYFNELATEAGVASLSEEDPARPVAECRLITRPLKLGSLEYKRLETLAARMRRGEGLSFRLEVEGSDDAIRWFSLRSEQNRSMIRRTPSSFRYHRFRLVGSGADYLTITHFDVEFYNRFIHRLR
ncbi:MAG: hypothetical protein K2G93_03135 [Rikenella sp.]|nr:hypothetical protein [Rikenella sp.]